MLFYTYDLDKYRDVLRGFYIDMETELPGPLVYTTEEVIDKIKNLDLLNEQYQDVFLSNGIFNLCFNLIAISSRLEADNKSFRGYMILLKYI